MAKTRETTQAPLDAGWPADEAAFRAAYPALAAAFDAWKAANKEPPRAVRIRSLVEGFRRGGIKHSLEPVEHRTLAGLRPEQLDRIFAEPKLSAEFVP